LGGGSPRWTSMWSRVAIITALGCLGALFVPWLPDWIFYIGLFLMVVLLTPITGGNWPGMTPYGPPVGQTAVIAYYPAGYFEVSRFLLKLAWVRILVWLPLALILAAALSTRTHYGPAFGAWVALKGALVLTIIQVGFAASKHSQGTNDSKRFSLGSAIFWLL